MLEANNFTVVFPGPSNGIAVLLTYIVQHSTEFNTPNTFCQHVDVLCCLCRFNGFFWKLYLFLNNRTKVLEGPRIFYFLL